MFYFIFCISFLRNIYVVRRLSIFILQVYQEMQLATTSTNNGFTHRHNAMIHENYFGRLVVFKGKFKETGGFISIVSDRLIQTIHKRFVK